MNQKSMQKGMIVALTILLVGCGAPLTTPIPPTATPEPPAVFGTLIGPEGAIIEAKITLQTYQDESCVKLAEASKLSESDKNQLEICLSDFASTTSDTEGQYRFPEVSPGWYKLIFRWELSKELEYILPFEVRDGFLIAYFNTTQTPIKYYASAQGDIFYFSGMEDMVIDFDY